MVNAILMHELWTPALCHRSPSNAVLFCLSQRSDKRVPQILTDHVALQVGLTLYVAGWGIGPGGPELGQSILSTLKLEAHQLLDAPPWQQVHAVGWGHSQRHGVWPRTGGTGELHR